MLTYPRGFNHIGLSVPDIERAKNFYCEALGAYLVMPPTRFHEDGSQVATICTDIFGPGWEWMDACHLSMSNGVGIELWQFKNSKNPENNFDFGRTSVYHFCITDPDIEGAVERIKKHGGKHRSKIWQIFPDRPGKMTYCEDPFGIILEIYTHSYEATWVR